MDLVKFMFPNEYLVYLHDTPAVHRFEARRRTFSNGCVRVAKPELLAEWLLDDERWDLGAVECAMHAGEQRVVPLREHVPVELRYFTAWLDAEGGVQFPTSTAVTPPPSSVTTARADTLERLHGASPPSGRLSGRPGTARYNAGLETSPRIGAAGRRRR